MSRGGADPDPLAPPAGGGALARSEPALGAAASMRLGSEDVLAGERSEWDYIVIGAGSAGCAVAARLAEREGNRVLLLEAGGADRSPLLKLPAAVMYVMRNPAFDWRYAGEPDPSLLGRRTLWSAGKVLGGSSSINGMVYVRGLAGDFERWVAGGAQGWDFGSVLPYFRRLERWMGEPSAARGTDGPVRVSPPAHVHPLAHALLRSASELGYRVHADLNAGIDEGFGLTQTSIAAGLRSNAAGAYLRGLVRRGRLQIAARAEVARLLFDGTRCCGVELVQGGQRRRMRCGSEVVLSAGAIGSPTLLLRSGIGPAAALEALGIEVRRHSPEVGRNLQEHAGIAVAFSTNVPTINREGRGWRALRTGARWLLRRDGPAAMSVVNVTGFVRTQASLSAPDVQLQFVPLGYDDSGARPRMAREDRVGFTVNPCRPLSRGEIRLAAPGLDAPPIIDHRLLGAPEDVATLTAGAQLVRRLAATPPFANAMIEEVFPGPAVRDPASWERIARETAFLQAHPCGTCRMGGEDAVLDPQLRVRGVRGLRVADASAMPTILSGNTNAASMMIGERAADFVLAAARAAQP